MQIHVGTEKYLWKLHKTRYGHKYFMKVLTRFCDGTMSVTFIHLDKLQDT
jgi:hypothetical protein